VTVDLYTALHISNNTHSDITASEAFEGKLRPLPSPTPLPCGF